MGTTSIKYCTRYLYIMSAVSYVEHMLRHHKADQQVYYFREVNNEQVSNLISWKTKILWCCQNTVLFV